MFLGHFALALSAKKAAPKASLGTLVLSAQFADCLWPVLLLLGVEQVRIVPGLMRASPFDFVSYPISHSLLMQFVWGLLFGVMYLLWRRDIRTALDRRRVAANALAARLFRPSPGHAALPRRRPEGRPGHVEFASADAACRIRVADRRRGDLPHFHALKRRAQHTDSGHSSFFSHSSMLLLSSALLLRAFAS